MRTSCTVCLRRCALEEGQVGFCRARICREGRVVPLNYGKITSLALDPIEKKPLRRFHPGGQILSLGSFGCNLRCPFCQNYTISMAGVGDCAVETVTPEELGELAEGIPGNLGAAYTYNEPLVGFEFVRDCARELHRRGLLNVLVTNGTAAEEVWEELLPLIDAMNIDLKGFTEAWYRRLGGDLETVKRNIARAAERCHVEVTTLLVPGENDNPEEIRELSRFLAGIRRDIPLHLSRFFPRWQMTDRPPTPIETVTRLRDAAAEALEFVYTGNC